MTNDELLAIRKRNEERKAQPRPFPDAREVLAPELWAPRAHDDIDTLLFLTEQQSRLAEMLVESWWKDWLLVFGEDPPLSAQMIATDKARVTVVMCGEEFVLDRLEAAAADRFLIREQRRTNV